MPEVHPHHKAHRHLSRKDRVMKRLIKSIGPCTLRHDPDGFGVLVRAIVSQQISTKAAKSITARLQELQPLTPAALLRQKPDKLRAAYRTAFSLAADLRAVAIPASLITAYCVLNWSSQLFSTLRPKSEVAEIRTLPPTTLFPACRKALPSSSA